MILKIVLGIAVLILLGITFVQDVTLTAQAQVLRQMAESPGCLGGPPQVSPPLKPELYITPEREQSKI